MILTVQDANVKQIPIHILKKVRKDIKKFEIISAQRPTEIYSKVHIF